MAKLGKWLWLLLLAPLGLVLVIVGGAVLALGVALVLGMALLAMVFGYRPRVQVRASRPCPPKFAAPRERREAEGYAVGEWFDAPRDAGATGATPTGADFVDAEVETGEGPAGRGGGAGGNGAAEPPGEGQP